MELDDRARTAFRLSVSQREAPRALAVAGLAFALITLLNTQFGPPMPVPVLLMNLTVSALLLIGAYVVGHAHVPAAAAPWILALGALVLVAIGIVQVWETPDPTGFVYILLIIVLYGILTVSWLPAIVVAVPMLAGCILLATRRFPDLASDWVIASIASLAIGMSLLWLRLRSVDELAEKSALIGELATRDQLTGTLNRHGIEERIPELLGMAVRDQVPVFAVFADIDGLKAVNDAHGHQFGDGAIVVAAEAIRDAVRAGDLVARWGGDEFLVLGLGHVDGADQIAERIVGSIARSGIDLGKWPDGLSVGLAAQDPDGLDIEALIGAADTDMYDRRRAHRGDRRQPHVS